MGNMEALGLSAGMQSFYLDAVGRYRQGYILKVEALLCAAFSVKSEHQGEPPKHINKWIKDVCTIALFDLNTNGILEAAIHPELLKAARAQIS